MNILFICTANRDRSKTAEHIFQKKYSNFSFSSAGIDENLCNKFNGKHVDFEMCDWADRIICMEEHHAQYLLKKMGDAILHKIEILGIEDTEEYMSSNLIMELRDKFNS